MNSAGARALQRVDEYEERFVSKPRLELVEDPAPVTATPAPAPVPGERRTIRISGQPTAPRRRPAASSRVVSAPDRLALYAVLLGLFLIFMAVVTASS
jgi:cell division septation protein DedD